MAALADGETPPFRVEEAALISSINHHVVDPDRLALLYRVLDDSFEEVTATRPPSDPGMEMDIRVRLAQEILEAFDRGVVDPERLKRIAVRSLAPKPDDIG
jgi:hypothetical protein